MLAFITRVQIQIQNENGWHPQDDKEDHQKGGIIYFVKKKRD